MTTMTVPLFPLGTVLYPEGPLPLRLFEARYIDMVSQCMREQSPFGVVAIREGREVGPSVIYEQGTLARITDFYQGSDGLLGITATGHERFRLLSEHEASDGLRIGEIELLPDEPAVDLPEDYAALAEMLDSVLDDLGKLYEDRPRRLDDASWVGYRYCEILPIRLPQKQQCLEVEDALARLELIAAVLSRVPSNRSQ
ncbi:MAG: LON peptidase substrate-binding domain-containing protein [Pseudomonadota bacterium]